MSEIIKNIIVCYSLIIKDNNTTEALEAYLQYCRPVIVDEMEEAIYVIEREKNEKTKKYSYDCTLLLTKRLNGQTVPFMRIWSPDDYFLKIDYLNNRLYLHTYDCWVSQDMLDEHGEYLYTIQRGANRHIYIKTLETYIVDTTPGPLDKLLNRHRNVNIPAVNGMLTGFANKFQKGKEK